MPAPGTLSNPFRRHGLVLGAGFPRGVSWREPLPKPSSASGRLTDPGAVPGDRLRGQP
jgi:hypothetical protein